MLTSFIFILGGDIIAMFAYAFGLLGWNFPTPIVTAFQTFFSVLHAFSPFIPFIGDMVAIGLILIPAHVIRYGIDIIRWIWAHIPIIGTQARLPNGAIDQPHQPYYQSIRQSDNYNDPQRQTFQLYKRKKSKRQS